MGAGGKKSYTKGRRGENDLVKLLVEYGIPASRISVPGLEGPDVRALHRDIEVKSYAAGFFRFDYDNLEDAQILFKRASYERFLAVMRIEELLDLLDDAYDRGRAGEPMWPDE